MSNKRRVLEWLYRLPAREELVYFEDLLTEAASQALEYSDIAAEEYAESNRNRIWKGLLQEEADRIRAGLHPTFKLNDSTHKLGWHAFSTPKDKVERRRLLRLRSRPTVLSQIDLLTWREYEALGCLICAYCGAAQTYLTSPGNECGIDFFAVLQVSGNNHVFSGASSRLRLIGQSKKYDTPVDVEKVRAFNETIDDVKKLEQKASGIIPAWFRAARGPIVGWIVSHSGFQEGAKTRADNHGILASDSFDLAEIAALSRNLPEAFSPEQRAVGMSKQVKSILGQYDSM
jgi:hypothetical protein